MKLPTWLVVSAIGVAVLALGGVGLARMGSVTVSNEEPAEAVLASEAQPVEEPKQELEKIDPADVRSLYTPSWIFANAERRAELIATAKKANANALVIDVKDTTGVIIPDELGAWVREVRDAGLIPIARVVVFQDNAFAKAHPDAALQNTDGSLWVHKGLYWLDPAAPSATDHTVEVAKRAADLGFLEINLDYVRFPTDGNVDAIRFPHYVRDTPRAPVIAKALSKITESIKADHPNVIVSADLYAFSFLVEGDVGIGQNIVALGPTVDVIAPMIYPSHYSTGNFGFANPAAHPYEVTDGTLEKGLSMLARLPEDQRPIVRSWIQAFDMGAEYTPEMIRKSRQALVDNWLGDSWMAWNATARYEPEGFALPLNPAPAKPEPAPAASSTPTT
jgi:hypothetical protein